MPQPWELTYTTTPRPPSDFYGGPAPFTPLGGPGSGGYGSQYDPTMVSHAQWFQSTFGRQPANEAERMAWTDERQRVDPQGWLRGEEELARETQFTNFQTGAGPEPINRPQSFERTIAAPPPVPTNPQFPSGAPESIAPYNPAQDFNRVNPENLARAAGQGFFGLGDEIAALPAAIRGAFTEEGFGPAYDRAVEEERQRLAMFQESHPGAATAAQLAGGLATGAGAYGLGASFVRGAAPTASSLVPRATADAAAYGALTGFGAGETLPERARNAGVGAVMGAASGPIAGAIGARFANAGIVRAAPTEEALRDASRVLFDQARSAGVQFETLSFDNAVRNIRTNIQGPGFRAVSTPHAFAALDELQALPAAPTFDDVNAVRQVLSQISRRDADPAEREVARRILGELDGYLGNLTPADVLAGDPAAASLYSSQARNLWRLAAKSDTITTALETAYRAAGAGSPTGLQAAIRTQFRTIARNQALMRGYTPEEQAMIEEIATGGFTENALRALGQFAPSNVLSSIRSGLGAGGAAGGAVYAATQGMPQFLAVPVAAEGAARLSTSMTRQNVNLLGASIRSGGAAQPPRIINPLAFGVGAGAPAATIGLPQTDAALDYILPPPMEGVSSPLPWERQWTRRDRADIVQDAAPTRTRPMQ